MVNIVLVAGLILFLPVWLWGVLALYPYPAWLGFSATVGHVIQSENRKDTAARSEFVDDIIMTNLKSPTLNVSDSGLVMASIVVAASHWQTTKSIYRQFVGGKVPALKKPLEWGRDEVIVRLKEKAKLQGWTQLHNIRLETSVIGNVARGKGLKTELHAYATGARNT